MRRVGAIVFQEPPGWTESLEGTRHIYTSGPNRLTVWSNLLEGNNGAPSIGPLRDRILQEALQIAETAAAQPNLTVLKPLTRDEGLCALPCWTVASHTADQTSLFLSAVVQGSRGILFATLEAALGPESLATMEAFLRSVREEPASP
jgi:hypothetical protein